MITALVHYILHTALAAWGVLTITIIALTTKIYCNNCEHEGLILNSNQPRGESIGLYQ